MKRIALTLLGVLMVVSLAQPVLVQASDQDTNSEQYLELMRQDLRSNMTAIFTEAMMLNDAQGKVFWPLYREYMTEVSKLGDQRIELIKEYAAKYNSMDDDTANAIMDKVLKLAEDRHDLRKKYYKKMRKKLGGVLAARFYQVDKALNEIVDLQVSSEIPLVLKTAQPAAEKK